MNPSRDIDTSSTTLPVANLHLRYTFGAAVRRRQIGDADELRERLELVAGKRTA